MNVDFFKTFFFFCELNFKCQVSSPHALGDELASSSNPKMPRGFSYFYTLDSASNTIMVFLAHIGEA